MENFNSTYFCGNSMTVPQYPSSTSNGNGQHLSPITPIPPPYAQPQPLTLQYLDNNIYMPQHLPYDVEPPLYAQPHQPLTLHYPDDDIYMPQHLPYDVEPLLYAQPHQPLALQCQDNNIYMPQHLPYVEPPPLIEPSTVNNGVDITQGSSSVSVYMQPDNSCTDLPPGYRFNPKDEELILHYYMKKVSNQPLPCNYIIDVDVYKCTPWDLAEKLMLSGDKKGFFFTPRDRRYVKGQRPNRRAVDGYWKATGASQNIKYTNRRPYHDNVYGDIVYGDIIGTKRALVFYKGSAPKGDKTQWIMHEYELDKQDNQQSSKRGTAMDMRLDDYVLCSIYYKGKTLKGSAHQDNVNFNDNDYNVEESSSSTEYMQLVERLLDGGSENSGSPSKQFG